MIAKINWYFLVPVLCVLCACDSDNPNSYPREISKDNEVGVLAPRPDSIVAIKSSCNGQMPSTEESEANIEVEESEDSVDWEGIFRYSLSPEPETYEINSSEEHLISCENGTTIYIPKGAFESENVTLEVEEYYSMTDLISNDLSTISNDEILESGGTIHISAIDRGKEMELADGKELTILFPKAESSGMQTYYGERDENGLMNWELDSSIIEEQNKRGLFEGESIFYIQMSDGRRSYKKRFRWKMKNSEEYLFDHFDNTYNDINQELFRKLRYADWLGNYDSLGNRIDTIQSRYSVERITSKIATVQFAKSGHVDVVEFWPNNRFRNKINQFMREKMDPVDVQSMDLDKNECKRIIFNIFKIVDRQYVQNKFLARMDRDKDQIINKMPDAELDNYILTSKKLGWINCDKPIERMKSTEYYVYNDDDLEAKYYMIFKEFNSMVAATPISDGQYGYYKRIPKNSEVKIIGFSFDGDQPLISVEETTIDDKGTILPRFRPFTFGELADLVN